MFFWQHWSRRENAKEAAKKGDNLLLCENTVYIWYCLAAIDSLNREYRNLRLRLDSSLITQLGPFVNSLKTNSWLFILEKMKHVGVCFVIFLSIWTFIERFCNSDRKMSLFCSYKLSKIIAKWNDQKTHKAWTDEVDRA